MEDSLRFNKCNRAISEYFIFMLILTYFGWNTNNIKQPLQRKKLSLPFVYAEFVYFWRHRYQQSCKTPVSWSSVVWKISYVETKFEHKTSEPGQFGSITLRQRYYRTATLPLKRNCCNLWVRVNLKVASSFNYYLIFFMPKPSFGCSFSIFATVLNCIFKTVAVMSRCCFLKLQR